MEKSRRQKVKEGGEIIVQRERETKRWRGGPERGGKMKREAGRRVTCTLKKDTETRRW